MTRSSRTPGAWSFQLWASPSATSLCKRCVTLTDASPATLEPDALVDTSVAVPLVVADHAHHHAVIDAVGNRTLGLAGPAAFETFSIITRLPPPAPTSPGAVARLIAHNFPATRFLSDHA